MQVIFHEQYGDVSRAQLAAYRKFNVSPADHDELVDVFGKDAHAAITAAVKKYSPSGMFESYTMWRSER